MTAAAPRDYRTIAGPVAYTARNTRRALFNVAWDAADSLIAGDPDVVVRFQWDRKARQFSCVAEGKTPVVVRFSGRTEREASYAIHGNAS